MSVYAAKAARLAAGHTARCQQAAAMSSARNYSSQLFMGLDSSTQGLKATIVDKDLNVQHSCSVNYTADLSKYNTTDGFHEKAGGVVTTPVHMLIEALDVLIGRMKNANVPLHNVIAVSGSGQQHGSVYWKRGARTTLRFANWTAPLTEQLKDAFSRQDCPIWRDSSTTKQCRQLEKAVGGWEKLAGITGSRAYERFTANQILKIAQDTPDVLENTERVSLISSFMCSLLLGDYAPIDVSDGSGMNLLDIRTHRWSPAVLRHMPQDLDEKLGEPVPAHTVVGRLSSYFVAKYGFSSQCRVVAWSGDNPNSLAGLGLHVPGDVGVSLGTSDTIFSITPAHKSKPGYEGHIFVSPVDPKSHMTMLCYKNGSLARKHVADRVADGSWDKFNALVESTPPGNSGNIGFFFEAPEIIPDVPVAGIRRFNSDGDAVADSFDAATEARAVIESQMLSMRLHKARMGVIPKRIIVTGGASTNPTITKIIADVFNASVFAVSQPDSASLGAAFRARHAMACLNDSDGMVPFDSVVNTGAASELVQVASPDPGVHSVYTNMLDRYEKLEDAVVSSCQQS